jgi:fructokinase
MRIGVDIGGTKIEAIALADDGAAVMRERIAAPQGDYVTTIEAVVDLVARVGGDSPDAPVGVGTPGAISPATGLLKNSNSTWLIGKPLDRDLEAALGRPVRVANDANCFALSEAVDGAAAGADVVFGVILGTGVGGGLVVNRSVLGGPNAIAGEWGHNPLPRASGADEQPGPQCYCGRHGCIETFLSGPGLAADHARVTGEDLSPREIAAAENEPNAAATLVRYEERLARALASVVNVVDPDVIVLGGGLSNIERLYPRVPELWASHIFSDTVRTRLVRHRHGDSSGVRGAAWLWPVNGAPPQ